MRDIVPNFFAKAIQVFNMRDLHGLVTLAAPTTHHSLSTSPRGVPILISTVLDATFDPEQHDLVVEALSHASTDEDTHMLLGLSPHERAVLLAQSLAALIFFLHKLADSQWPHRNNSALTLPPATLTAMTVQRAVDEIRAGHEKRELLETIENSPIFSTCRMKQEVAGLIVKAVEHADKVNGAGGQQHPYFDDDGVGGGGSLGHHGRMSIHHPARSILVVDDADLEEISLSFVNDKGPDDMVLPCGLRILPLN